MPDDFKSAEFERQSGLRIEDALQALPLLTPPRSAWPGVQSALAARARPRPHGHWLAAAAVLALAAVLPSFLSTPPAPTVVSSAVQDEAQLRALMTESAQLEALIEWSRGAPVESAASASLAAAVQDRIGEVDALLVRADLDPEARLPLWQERVLRLRQLAGLSSTQELLAANGEADPGLPVLAF